MIFAQTIGGTTQGLVDGNVNIAKFYYPRGVCVDHEGNIIVVDMNNRVRRISISNGKVQTIAGSSHGFEDGKIAKFNNPHGVCVDPEGNIIVADSDNHKIRKIMKDGYVQTIAGTACGLEDGNVNVAKFNNPYGVCIDLEGNIIVADCANHKIRKITKNGIVSTIAGTTLGYEDGNVSVAKFNSPHGVSVDREGNIIIADTNNHKIRQIMKNGTVSTIAGTTAGFEDYEIQVAKFNYPMAVCVDREGIIFVSDHYNHKIRRITKNGFVQTFAGSSKGFEEGNINVVRFSQPFGICIDHDGNIIVADYDNHKIRKLTQLNTKAASEPQSQKINKAILY